MSAPNSVVATPTKEKAQGDAAEETEEKPELVPENLAIETEDSASGTQNRKEWKHLEILGDARSNPDGEKNEAAVVDDWESECPLFMTKLPDNPADNPYLAALEAIANDEVDREYTAEELKARGNVCFQRCVFPACAQIDSMHADYFVFLSPEALSFIVKPLLIIPTLFA